MQLPAATARALLQGFRVLGLDEDAIRLEAGIRGPELDDLDGAFPIETFERLWRAAMRRAPREELPTEVGLAIPFGAFGALDYLAGSSADVESAFHSLAAHFRQVATGFAIEVQRDDSGGTVRLVATRCFAGQQISDEFSLAVFAGHFRRALADTFRIDAVSLTRPAPSGPTRHEALFGAPVAFGCRVSALELPRATWTQRLRGADPVLHETLRSLAARLELGPAQTDLEIAVRARLRSLLPSGSATAEETARALGMSERTLQRRLGEAGTTFKDVLEAFREAEAERLLKNRVPLAEIALRLGFSDQTAWNRAFRRWKGVSPTEWNRRSPGPR